MSKPVWLEVAVNGGWTRKRQPLIPVTADEIIAEALACARAGAAIVHLHPYDTTTGRQNDDSDTYARIIEGVRARSDVIVYPTIAQMPDAPESEARYAPMVQLGERGLIEWAPVDPGTTNFSRFADIEAGKHGYVYVNSERHIRTGLQLAAQYRCHPNYAIYEPGFLRLGAALARQVPGLPAAMYRFMFTGDHAYGFPVRKYALDSYLQLLAEEAPGAQWMVAGRGSDITPLIGAAVEAGGHVRVGLEDAPLGSAIGNLQLVENAAEAIAKAGGRLAKPSEVRRAFG